MFRSQHPIKTIEWSARYLYGIYYMGWRYNGVSLSKNLNSFAIPCAYSIASRLKKIRPLPVTYAPLKNETINKINFNRKFDLSFMLNLGRIQERHIAYKYLLDMIKRYPAKKFLISPGNIKKSKYNSILIDSKASVAIRGIGQNSFRYWEIPYYGATLMSQRSNLIIPNNFIDGESALFFTENAELEKKFNKYVVKSDEWKEIANNGRALYFKHHTPKKRVEELILEPLKRVVDGR